MGAVRDLFREYAAWVGSPITAARIEHDLADLSTRYQVLLIAAEPGGIAGCVALRRWEGDIGEMKRLYVRPAWQRKGIGRMLAERVIAEARAAGFRSLRLDTLPMMTRAIPLYRSLGFSEIPRYGDHLPEAICFELQL
jgi:ribosomal protein S18 acetylase RimI-like enzyme